MRLAGLSAGERRPPAKGNGIDFQTDGWALPEPWPRGRSGSRDPAGCSVPGDARAESGRGMGVDMAGPYESDRAEGGRWRVEADGVNYAGSASMTLHAREGGRRGKRPPHERDP